MNGKIAPSLAMHETLASELKTHPKNARKGDLNLIADSLTRFGQVKPIVTMKDGTIVAGNHTYRAATEVLKWETVAAVEVELTDEEALQYLLADNRAADVSGYDTEALHSVLEEMMLDGLLDGTGYSPDDVDDLMAEAGQVLEAAYEPFSGDFGEDPEVTAERFAAAAAQARMEERKLLYTPERAEAFDADVKALGKAWGLGGLREVVAEAVRRCADQEAGR